MAKPKQPHNEFTAPWTEDEVRILKQNWKEKDDETAKLLNRTPESVRAKRKRLRLLHVKKARLWSEREITVLRNCYQKMTFEELGKRLHRSHDGVQCKMSQLGLKKRTKSLQIKFYPSDLDKGILVGLIEGEGGMGLLLHRIWRYKNRRYLRPYISIANMNFDMLYWVRNVVGKGSISKPKKGCGNYQLVGQERVLSVLKVLEPYFITERRRKQARIMIEFCKRRIQVYNRGGTSPYSKQDIQAFLELRKLNKKGPESQVPEEWLKCLNVKS